MQMAMCVITAYNCRSETHYAFMVAEWDVDKFLAKMAKQGVWEGPPDWFNVQYLNPSATLENGDYRAFD